MGQRASRQRQVQTANEDGANALNREANIQLPKAQPKDGTVKVLLLGTRDAGKTTLLTQIQLLHNLLTDDQRNARKGLIYGKTMDAMRSLLDALGRAELEMTELESAVQFVIERTENYAPMERISPELANAIISLWTKEIVKYLEILESSDYEFPDHAFHFLSSIERISHPDYVPSDDDIIKASQSTTGATKITFMINNHFINIFDLGGVRSERSKWHQFFEKTSAIFFIVALSEYDQVLYEDSEMSRMQESMMLFKTVSNNKKWFSDTSIILFLNKTDLFAKKVSAIPIGACFSDFKGPNEYTSALLFIKNSFLKLEANSTRTTYMHEICAIDTEGMRKILTKDFNHIIYAHLLGNSTY